MKIDFHTHVKISKKSMFMPDYFKEMMKEAKASGLTAIAMTEHFNTLRFLDIYQFLDQHYEYQDDYYDIDGLKLFSGIEVDIKEVGHILLIGGRNDILEIHSKLVGHTEAENFIPFKALLDLAEKYNVLKIGAHAFRKSTPLYHLDREQLSRLDAFDLNGKDLYSQGVDLYKEKLNDLASDIGRPVVGGSDTHQYLQYGSVMNHLHSECRTIDDLKTSIYQRNYTIDISPSLSIKVKSAKLVKKLMKQLLENKVDVIS
jgi:histidinol phosphatase-like PHP family hydrolase